MCPPKNPEDIFNGAPGPFGTVHGSISVERAVSRSRSVFTEKNQWAANQAMPSEAASLDSLTNHLEDVA